MNFQLSTIKKKKFLYMYVEKIFIDGDNFIIIRRSRKINPEHSIDYETKLIIYKLTSYNPSYYYTNILQLVKTYIFLQSNTVLVFIYFSNLSIHFLSDSRIFIFHCSMPYLNLYLKIKINMLHNFSLIILRRYFSLYG